MRHRTLPILVAAALLLGGAVADVGPAHADDEVFRFRLRLEKLFRRLDLNGDGRLDRQEARANAYLQRHFERLDRGDKGYLLPEDLSR
jgi:hypothetical protein